MARRVVLRAVHLRRIRELAEAAWPLEACGVLEGSAGAGPVAIAVVHHLPNIHPEPRRRYTIDPEAWLRIEHAARLQGRIMVGVWHSHPNGDANPSSLDREQAWPDWSYLIAGVTNGGMNTLRCWHMHEDVCEEQTLVLRRP